MPWKESDRVTERLDFIARLRAGERITDLCSEYGISRKTGHKLKKRFELEGPKGLYDRSRRPERSPHRTPETVVEQVLAMRRSRPTWGPKKLRAKLETEQPDVRWPAASTIGVLLKDAGLVDGRRRRRRAWPTAASERLVAQQPNELWCMDFKGQFRLGNRQYCYPLTVTDQASRYLLGCEALECTKAHPAAAALELVFRDYGLPTRMRSDNGSPFASTGLGGLTQLSAWLLRLGIGLERIDPGCPQQNGRHERMHLTLKQETTRPAAHSLLQQQERFDRFRTCFNDERPHEALDMQTPAKVYQPARRLFPDALPQPDYPLHDEVRPVSKGGQIRFRGRDVSISKALMGQQIGLRHIEQDVWLVSFMDLDLAYLDPKQGTTTPIPHSTDPTA
jgi:transposase InsO family protein